MNAQSETFEDEYEEYDEFEDEEADRGLSGLVVLLMGVVMLGAFASIVWIAYQQGIKTGAANDVPTVVADPDPVKIENQDVADAAAAAERPVYDQFDGAATDGVEVLTEGPEEPVARDAEDPIAAIASETQGDDVVDDAVADRIEQLAAADAALEETAPEPEPATTQATVPPTPASTTVAEPPSTTTTVRASAGTHLVQVGAFRSDEEANAMWDRLEGKLGNYLDGKAPDIERADLGDKGVFYRLRIGPFTSSDAAKTYCEGLKSRGQDCLVKAK